VGSITELVLLSGVFGLTSAPVFTAVGSFAPYLTEDPARLQGINSIVEAAAMAALVVGPGLGAVIVSVASVDWVFALDAATSIGAAWLVARVVTRPVPVRERRRGGSELREGVAFSYRRPMLRFVMLAGTAVWLAVGSFGALEPLFYRDVLDVDVQTLGWMFSIFGAGLVTGAATLGRAPRRVVSARGLAVVMAACGAGSVLYVGTDRLIVVALGAAVWGVIVGWLAPLIRTLLQIASPEPLVGRIAGVYQMHLHVAELLPLTFAPALAALFGVQAVLVSCGLALVVVGIAALTPAARIDTGPGRGPTIPFVVTDEPTSPVP
jgi:MFS family permease